MGLEARVNGVRVPSCRRTETAEQRPESVLRLEATWLATTVSTPMPNGIVTDEGNGVITTVDGDVVVLKKSGIGWLAGKGRRASRRGACFHNTQWQRFACLNKAVGMHEFESDEKGDWTIRIWEWK